MLTSKIYITLLVFIREGEADRFLQYEDRVLPLLSKYNGELLYRIRPQPSNFVHPTTDDQPFEIHVLTFPNPAAFEDYRQDKERLSYFPLFQKAVRQVILLQSEPV